VIVPLCDTPEQFLVEMIESVMAQTYSHWELCLADGSGADHEYAGHICKKYAEKDGRIKYCKIEGDSDISAISNTAMAMSGGEYIGILDHIDVLHPSALYEVMRAICYKNTDFIYTDEAIFSNAYVTLKHYKSDYAIDTLCSYNYIGHFMVFSKKLADKAGIFRSEFNGSHEYDLALRYTGIASNVYHIQKLMYFKRSNNNTVVSDVNNKSRIVTTGKKAIREHLITRGISAVVENIYGLPGFYKVIYELTEKPLVSIIIPNKDNVFMLQNCISFIIGRTTYENYEIIIVENNSTNNVTFSYYDELKRYPNISVVYWEGEGFNYSEICNFGVQHANGKQLLFLNNDVLIIAPNWIEEMLMYSQRDDVGIVGGKLHFLNGTIQHAGVVLGLGGIAGHIYLGEPHHETGFMAKLQIVQNMSAVTAACMMIRRSVFDEVGFFSPEFCDSFNDVDLCLKVRSAGYLIVWTPYATAYHFESKSRGYYSASGKKRKLLAHETDLFCKKWDKELAAGDPYYNPNLFI
jgi:GT2 family glycosyltransferase